MLFYCYVIVMLFYYLSVIFFLFSKLLAFCKFRYKIVMFVCIHVINVPYQINHASLNSRHKFCFFSVTDPDLQIREGGGGGGAVIQTLR